MKKDYVWSSEIFAYAVCPEKYRLKYREKRDVPPTREMVLGSLSHKLREALTAKEGAILESVEEGCGVREIEAHYMSHADEVHAYAIAGCAGDLRRIGIEEQEALDFLSADYSCEVLVRSVRVLKTMRALGIERGELAEYLAPPWRYVEYKIMDKGLHMACVVDRIERQGGTFYPIEIKTGKPPIEDVYWPQKIQLACHAMLVERHFAVPIRFGFIEYTQIAEKRPVWVDEETRQKVELMRDCILAGTIAEKRTASCGSCEYRGVCV